MRIPGPGSQGPRKIRVTSRNEPWSGPAKPARTEPGHNALPLRQLCTRKRYQIPIQKILKKVISIWGPTHHYFGFGPLNNEHLIIEKSIDDLPCRPCSIYGKTTTKSQEECAEKSMSLIKPETVVEKITEVLNNK